MTIRVLVIDDEPLARDDLKYMLSRYDDIRVEGEASNESEALQLIKETNPDLIFLDILMPKSDGMPEYPAGLSLAKSLTELSRLPFFIFVTGYPEYAFEGYQYEPLHYVTKPIEDQRLEDAINRARKLLSPPALKVKIRHRLSNPTKYVESYVEIREIVLIQKVKGTDTAEVYLYGGNVLEGVRTKLEDFKEELNEANFFQPHISFLVNLTHVSATKIGPDNSNLLLNGIEKKIPISKANLNALREALKSIGNTQVLT